MVGVSHLCQRSRIGSQYWDDVLEARLWIRFLLQRDNIKSSPYNSPLAVLVSKSLSSPRGLDRLDGDGSAMASVSSFMSSVSLVVAAVSLSSLSSSP